MATLSFHSIPFSSSTLPTPSSSSSSSLAFRTFFPFQNSKLFLPRRARTTCNNTNNNRRSRWLFVTKAVEEEVQQQQQQEEATTEQQPVVVPVSPSDTLTMFFQAEGTMSESAIPTVSKALEDDDEEIKEGVDRGVRHGLSIYAGPCELAGICNSYFMNVLDSAYALRNKCKFVIWGKRGKASEVACVLVELFLSLHSTFPSFSDIEGVASLKVQVLEGLATVELKKQTTVQATGVASSLVETIQGSGFKLQTLNLSFDEEYVAAE
ncbi:hypothetical protein Ahy_B05g075981 [Arachis hypogaea]|uniref:Uncharacterized protein n=1 Tax=Arachis hypogaea TaxID=3818 RepID=A0A444Z2E0_ARAHY|nr:hypothetical protein Ahy_B05g075981 [Arachis hypogaea]